MKSINFGEQLPSSGNIFLKVKQKGDQIRFRIAQNPVYSGKHFLLKENGGWDIQSCPRVNDGEECDKCELYFKGMAEAKKLRDTDPEESKKIEKEARVYSCAITFYFPVLNRDTESFGILQTTQGVRNKINLQHEAGVDVFKKEWILRNTGSTNPNEIYSLVPVDSADVKQFSEKEALEFEKAKNFDLMQINDGSSQTDEIE